MLCVAKGLLHVAKVLLYAAKVLLCNAKVLLYAAGVAPRKNMKQPLILFIFSNVTDRFRQHHLTVRPSHPKSFLDRNPFLPETPPFSTLLFFCSFVLFSFRPSVLFSFCSFLLFSFCSFVLLSLPPFQIHNWYTTITPVVRFAHTHV